MKMRILKRLIVLSLASLVLGQSSFGSPRIQTVQFQSQLIGTTLPYNVILPPDYDASPTTRYPVLYLLHGLTGHYVDWVTRTNVADYASRYPMIIVTPEGNDSWYTDSAKNEKDKYESYVLKELIPDVQQRYRTIDARYGRAIAGLSMGGFGAIKFGLKSPATFVFAASMSGAFGAAHLTEKEVTSSGWQTSLQLFGPVGSETRKANDIFEIISTLAPNRVSQLPFFYFDCGTEDSSLIVSYNRELATLMLDKKIPHEFRQLPGDHSWGYWDKQVREVLRLAAAKMRLPHSSQSALRTVGKKERSTRSAVA